ncbi:MAG: adenylate/guanylate cyclase domain-containing protein [Gammaproteobacteria bacterium]|nr:adenylate/guanylate cyclase domain-containing protein [Gammaproteobacteria bacterium]
MSARILVVDDEPDLEMLVSHKFRRQIRDGELSFLFAADGEEALSVLREQEEVDLVLSDINMPRMDGLSLLRNLKELDADLRAVIVSAYGDMRNIRTAMNLGAFDFVTKPIEFADLEVTIKKTLEDLHKLREAYRLREAAEQARINLSRYFSPNLAEQLAKNPEFLKLGGERRELTFVFTDVADFTPLVETLDPSVIVPMLNEYLDGMTRIVFRHGGTTEKVVGDAVHAIFGAPVEQEDHAARGVACAMELDAFAEAFRQARLAEGIPFGVTRIGVHSGPAIVGNFGGDSFFDYTAHGDAINTAARLEAINKQLGTRVCVSSSVAGKIPGFKGRPVGNLVLKGKSSPLEVLEPLTEEQADSAAMQDYNQAYELLAHDDPTAKKSFAAVVGQHGDDPLATFHLKRLLAGETGVDIAFAEK